MRDQLRYCLHIAHSSLTPETSIGIEKEASPLRHPRRRFILLRHYKMPRASRVALGREIGQQSRRKNVGLLLAGTPNEALCAFADGVHIPRWRCHLYDRCCRAGWMRLWKRKPHWLITASAHNVQELRQALWGGADVVLLSPLFPTESHPEKTPLGLAQARRIVTIALRDPEALTSKKPAVVALGGIRKKTAQQASRSGIFDGLAGITYFWQQTNRDACVLTFAGVGFNREKTHRGSNTNATANSSHATR